jgi:hypothetical protein
MCGEFVWKPESCGLSEVIAKQFAAEMSKLSDGCRTEKAQGGIKIYDQ